MICEAAFVEFVLCTELSNLILINSFQIDEHSIELHVSLLRRGFSELYMALYMTLTVCGGERLHVVSISHVKRY